MATTDKLFAGSIPEIYQRFLVPLIFESYARDLAKRIVATDLNQPMLDQAAKRQSGDRRIEWRHADALALPFPAESFDVVVCQFGTMFFPDKAAAYKEARRVLRSGSHLIFNVWDRISENEFADVVTQALAEMFPGDPPRFLARVPHGYDDAEQIRRDLSVAGFSNISVDAIDEKSRASSPRDPAIAYCQGTPLRNEIEARDASGLEHATAQASRPWRDCLEMARSKAAFGPLSSQRVGDGRLSSCGSPPAASPAENVMRTPAANHASFAQRRFAVAA
jgi:SAM-dependent methyltransferase